MKPCSKCGIEKSLLDGFYVNNRAYDGLTSQCKECIREAQEEYRQSEKGKAQKFNYSRTEKCKQQKKDYRAGGLR